MEFIIRSDSNSLDPLTKEKVLPHAIEKMLLSKRGAMLWQRFQGSQEFIELRISRRQQKTKIMTDIKNTTRFYATCRQIAFEKQTT